MRRNIIEKFWCMGHGMKVIKELGNLGIKIEFEQLITQFLNPSTWRV